MAGFDWKSLVGTVAPTLATALGGPMAGMAVKALSGALLGTDDGSEKDIALALQGASPETMLALKKADQEFATKMAELEIDLEKINAGDRDSARQRQVAMRDWTPNVLAALILCMWGYVQYTLIQGGAPEGLSEGVLARILGMLDAAALIVLTYMYGSSAGSKAKTEHLASKK